MKKFNASDLSKKPSEVWAAARDGGAIIQHKDRSGKNVIEEFVISSKELYDSMDGIDEVEAKERVEQNIYEAMRVPKYMLGN
jgi:hypothetical protein